MRLPRLALLLIIPAFVCGASPSTPPHTFFNVVDGTQLDSDKNYATAQLPVLPAVAKILRAAGGRSDYDALGLTLKAVALLIASSSFSFACRAVMVRIVWQTWAGTIWATSAARCLVRTTQYRRRTLTRWRFPVCGCMTTRSSSSARRRARNF